MNIRFIESIDDLRQVMGFIQRVHPGIFHRGRRNFEYYARRLSTQAPLQLLAEDGGEIVGAFLGSTDNRRSAQASEYAVAAGYDFASVYEQLLIVFSAGVDRLGLASFMTHESGPEALLLETFGFSPTMFFQFFGDDRFEVRRRAVRDVLKDYRLLYAGEFGPAVNAVVAVDAVDHGLLTELSHALPTTLGNGFNMNQWGAGTGERRRSHVTRYSRPRFILSRYPRFAAASTREIREVDPKARAFEQLDVDALVIPNATPGRDLHIAFHAKAPTFIRHLAPVQVRVDLDGTRKDLDQLVQTARDLGELENGRTFSVQCRKGRSSVMGTHEEAAYSSRDVEIRVGLGIEERGWTVELKNPQQIVSIYLSGEYGYIGISKPEYNLFPRAQSRLGGRTPVTRISRAEHKLTDALEVWSVVVKPRMTALDLGAAPGGWSYVLAELGAQVTAVDPAALHPAAATHPRIRHLQARAEALNDSSSFDLIVNDMSIDPVESATLMTSLGNRLQPGTPAIMTIKLPDKHVWRHVAAAEAILDTSYEIEELRHFPHNRQEITALLYRLG